MLSLEYLSSPIRSERLKRFGHLPAHRKVGGFLLYLCPVPLPSAWDLQKPCTLGRINVTYHRAPQGLGRGVPAALRGFFFNFAA